jgi:hypothetical protein
MADELDRRDVFIAVADERGFRAAGDKLRVSGSAVSVARAGRALAASAAQEALMIRKLKDGQYRLYSRKKNPKTGKRRNLGTFKSRAAAEKHERAVQYFKRA